MQETIISIMGAVSAICAAYMSYRGQKESRIAARESSQANAAVNHRLEGQPRLFEMALESREKQAEIITSLDKISGWQDKCDTKIDTLSDRVSKVEAYIES